MVDEYMVVYVDDSGNPFPSRADFKTAECFVVNALLIKMRTKISYIDILRDFVDAKRKILEARRKKRIPELKYEKLHKEEAKDIIHDLLSWCELRNIGVKTHFDYFYPSQYGKGVSIDTYLIRARMVAKAVTTLHRLGFGKDFPVILDEMPDQARVKRQLKAFLDKEKVAYTEIRFRKSRKIPCIQLSDMFAGSVRDKFLENEEECYQLIRGISCY